MRIYFFGDIHGNDYALEACLRHMDTMKIDECYCVGDLVGWLPFGDRTLSRMRSLGIPTTAGNHDLLVSGMFPDHPHQIDRMQATAYNAGLLSTYPGALDYLSNLPMAFERENFTVVHHSPFHLPAPGTPPTIECFNYLDDTALAGCLQSWSSYPARLIFSGHDHLPAVYELPDGNRRPALEDVKAHVPPGKGDFTIRLNPASRYWIKGGSVGGPYRDGIPAVNSVLYDTESETLTLFRLEYSTARLYRDMASLRFCRILPTLRKYMELLEGRP